MDKKRNTILIVDDMEINRAILHEAFHRQYDILEAENGKQALALIESNLGVIAAILLDLVMPEMDGFETLQHLYRQGVLGLVPVFMITADCTEENIRHGYDMGVMDIIGKPISPYFVQRRVSSVIELYQAREQLSNVVKTQERVLEERAQEIQTLNGSIIETLATAIEFRDCESGEHVNRIHDLTYLMLCGLRDSGMAGCDFTEEQIEQIATASIMHDIGKIAIPDNILNKPGRLTEEEFEIMKTHTLRGCELLERIPKSRENPVYQYAYDICRHHHERWDGCGYPDGLRENEITIWSQTVSLADVYDALVSERVYKKAFTHEQAMKMILGGECGSFNPALLACLERLQYHIRETFQKKYESQTAASSPHT